MPKELSEYVLEAFGELTKAKAQDLPPNFRAKLERVGSELMEDFDSFKAHIATSGYTHQRVNGKAATFGLPKRYPDQIEYELLSATDTNGLVERLTVRCIVGEWLLAGHSIQPGRTIKVSRGTFTFTDVIEDDYGNRYLQFVEA